MEHGLQKLYAAQRMSIAVDRVQKQHSSAT